MTIISDIGKDFISLNQTENIEDEEELIAVITAAVAASFRRSVHTLVVRSVRVMPSAAPLWNRVGRIEQVSSRL